MIQKGPHRRQFMGRVGGIAATLAASASAGSSAASAESPPGSAGAAAGMANQRMMQAFDLRAGLAMQDSLVGTAKNVNNGDDALYPDKGGTFTKGLPHDSFGRVDLNSYETLKTALASGKFSDFEKIIMGGVRTLNGPQGGMAFDLEGLDNTQFAHQRWLVARIVHRFRRRATYGERRAEQARPQCFFRPRHPRRHPLAQRHRYVADTGRGGGPRLPER